MTSVLHVLPSFHPSGAARQIAHLAGDGVMTANVSVAAFGTDGVMGPLLRSRTATARAFGSRHRLDVTGWVQFARFLAESRPRILHTWRWPTLAATLALSQCLRPLGVPMPMLVASEVLRDRPRNGWTRLERLGLAQVAAFAVSGDIEADQLQRLGVPSTKIHLIPPAVRPPATLDATAKARLGIPPQARVVLMAGTWTADKRWRDALWAFHILKYRFDDLAFVACGDGPARAAARRFSERIGSQNPCVYWVGWQPDIDSLIASADQVWVMDRGPGGQHLALEALALGRPLLAANTPTLAERFRAGSSALLCDPNNKTDWVRTASSVLLDSSWADALGRAGRQLAQRYAPSTAAQAAARVYRALCP